MGPSSVELYAVVDKPTSSRTSTCRDSKDCERTRKENTKRKAFCSATALVAIDTALIARICHGTSRRFRFFSVHLQTVFLAFNCLAVFFSFFVNASLTQQLKSSLKLETVIFQRISQLKTCLACLDFFKSFYLCTLCNRSFKFDNRHSSSIPFSN